MSQPITYFETKVTPKNKKTDFNARGFKLAGTSDC